MFLNCILSVMCIICLLLGTSSICETRLDAPENGKVSIIETYAATYRCNEGYNLVGNAQRVCTDSGTWSGTDPTCTNIGILYLRTY